MYAGQQQQQQPEANFLYTYGAVKPPRRASPSRVFALSIAAFFVPVVVFAASFGAMIVSRTSVMAYMLIFVVALCALAVVALSLRARRNVSFDLGPAPPEARWFLLLAATTAVAWVVGFMLGEVDYALYFMDYYTLNRMGVYTDVDPAASTSGRYMDAGVLFFLDDATVNTSYAMSFYNSHEYCVAPLAGSDGSSTYNFWAVGMDCCLSRGEDFECASSSTNSSMGGLRVLIGNERSTYELAVEQAASVYGIEVTQTILVKIYSDPDSEIDGLMSDGDTLYWISIGVYAGLQMLAVFAFAMMFR